METCFKTFDKDGLVQGTETVNMLNIFAPRDNSININEFSSLIKKIFINQYGKPYL